MKKIDVSGIEQECLWVKVSRTNQNYFVLSVYHCETAFIEFLVDFCESILDTSPNARLIAGDINKLDLKSLTCTQQSGLSKLVKTPE